MVSREEYRALCLKEFGFLSDHHGYEFKIVDDSKNYLPSRQGFSGFKVHFVKTPTLVQIQLEVREQRPTVDIACTDGKYAPSAID